LTGVRRLEKAEEEDLIALMAGYQRGELASFERLYALVNGELQAYFTSAIHDAALARDLVQDTFLEVHRARHTYLRPLPLRPWLFAIARHVLARHRRRAWRRTRHEEPLGDHTASVSPHVEQHDLSRALAQLPPSRREPFILHHLHGYSFQQIAEQIGIGVVAAKLRSSRAMRTLRAALGGVGHDD
jgi:RNA polymerase sigma-70 factor (ECF subfamily)